MSADTIDPHNGANGNTTASPYTRSQATPESGTQRINKLLKSNTLLPLLLAGAATIALIIALFMWAGSDTYRVLFNNLGEADGGSIINELESRGVPYQLSANGAAILVPSEQVHVLRLQLAEQGLPQSGNVGFELMDNQSFGISQFAEQVNYQRSLEGELTRSMESMNPVASARVHLSMAKPSVFIREREPAKASIVLSLHPGRTLSKAQVKAITHLASSSVPELSAENVTVVSHTGELLSGPHDGSGIDGDNLAYTQEVERRYQQRIENILGPIFGQHNIRVQVVADIDFSIREQTLELFTPNQDPDMAAIRSAQLSGTLQGSEALIRGIPGALSNTPPGWAPTLLEQEGNPEAQNNDANQQDNNFQYNNLVNYELDRNITHIKHQQGQIERLSVAAVVNYRHGTDEEGTPISIALSETELTQIDNLVRQAMGFSEARGDALEIMNSVFSTDFAAQAAPEPEWWARPQAQELLLGLGRYVLALIFTLLLYRLVLRPLLHRHLATPLMASADRPAGATQPAPMTDTRRDAGSTEMGREEQSRDKRERKASGYEQDLKEVRQLAKDDPRLIAMVARSWMNKND